MNPLDSLDTELTERDAAHAALRQRTDWLVHRAWRNYWLGLASGLALALLAAAVGLYLAVA